MRSFKFMGIFILVVAGLLITTTIGINSQTLHAFDLLNHNERMFDRLDKRMSESELTVRVFENIALQTIDSEEKRAVLSKAYRSNFNRFNENIDLMKVDMGLIEFSSPELLFRDVNRSGKLRLKESFNSFLKDVETLEAYLSSEFDIEVIEDQQKTEMLRLHYLQTQEDLSKLHEQFFTYSEYTRNIYIRVFNVLICLSLAVTAIMGFVVVRVVRKDFKFVTRTYQQLEARDYDIRKFILKKPYFKEEQVMVDTVEKLFKDQKMSVDFNELVSQTYLMDDILDMFFDKVSESLGVDRIGIAFVDYKRSCIMAEYGVANYSNLRLGPGFEVNIESSSLKKLIHHHKGVINNDVEGSLAMKPTSPSLKLITQEGIKSNMIIPLVLNNVVFGFVFMGSKEKGHFEESHLRFASKIIYEITGSLNRSYLLKVVLSKMTTSFARLVDRKDNETGDHILRMVNYSTTIAEGILRMDLPTHPISRRQIIDIERYASVHDIGKVGIPDDILKKPGKLTSEEWEIMKTHVTIGAEIFSELRSDFGMFESDFYLVAEQITKFHHEKFDGSGYPYKLRGEEIPLVARIVALADVFDALTSERVYKKAFSFEEALEIINESRGGHFDPVVVDAFMLQIDEIKYIYNKNM